MASLRRRSQNFSRRGSDFLEAATGSGMSRRESARASARRSSRRQESGREKTSSSKKRKNSLFFTWAGKQEVGAVDVEHDDYADYGEGGEESKEDAGMHAGEYYWQDYMTPEELSDREKDRRLRKEFVEMCEEPGEYTDFEQDFIDEKFKFISTEDEFDWVTIKDKNSKNPKWKLHDEADPICYAKCSGVVATTPENLLAWYWNFDSYQSTRKHIDQNGDDPKNFPNRCEKLFNNHHHMLYACRKMPFPLSPRDFLSRGMWRRITRDKYVLCYHFEKVSESEGEQVTTSMWGCWFRLGD